MLSVEEIKSYIIPVVEKYPIEKVILFSSYARGDASDTSNEIAKDITLEKLSADIPYQYSLLYPLVLQ